MNASDLMQEPEVVGLFGVCRYEGSINQRREPV
jgi:hypothetical protein